MKEICVYIAVSLDGFIATEAGEVGWLESFQEVDYGYDAFLERMDTLVMGRVTYEQLRRFGVWPYESKPCIVVSQGAPAGEHPPGVTFSDGLPLELEGTVWLVGGRQLIHSYLKEKRVHSLELFIMPTLLGTGIPLFSGGTPPGAAALVGHTTYPNGVVRLLYHLGS